MREEAEPRRGGNKCSTFIYLFIIICDMYYNIPSVVALVRHVRPAPCCPVRAAGVFRLQMRPPTQTAGARTTSPTRYSLPPTAHPDHSG